MKHTYRHILESMFNLQATSVQPHGAPEDIKEVYAEGVRPVRERFRDMWMTIYEQLHEPHQRDEEIERIRQLKLQRENVAETLMAKADELTISKKTSSDQTLLKESKSQIDLNASRKQLRVVLKAASKKSDLKRLTKDKQSLMDDSVRFLGK